MSLVLAELSADLPAAVLVLVHISPETESALPTILASRSQLPVFGAEHGMPLLPGQVLVAPAGRHLVVTPQLHCGLFASGAFPPNRPSADLLLTTLALAAGPRAIAAVLTGGGHDAATGATAIKTFGGTVLATDEATSQNFSMPQATIDRNDLVDQVVPLPRLASLLEDLVRMPVLPVPPA